MIDPGRFTERARARQDETPYGPPKKGGPHGPDNGQLVDEYLQWLCEDRGKRQALTAMTRQQVLARIARSALPTGFPEACGTIQPLPCANVSA